MKLIFTSKLYNIIIFSLSFFDWYEFEVILFLKLVSKGKKKAFQKNIILN